MTYMLLLNCALKLVEEIILYYDARSKKHQITHFKISHCCEGLRHHIFSVLMYSQYYEHFSLCW